MKRILHIKQWDDADAKYHEWWRLQQWREPGRWRKGKWVAVKAHQYAGYEPVIYWSKEQVYAAARHYGIKVVEQ